ncbi:hypothetical protein CU098_010908 [Rhizopus stolonifer]|uniref:NADH dehydrogenase [ubiquinone] 1 alpha subcomplex assembly factor 3 n=1 Tax=Rhizopus stolonifer TaxID=4846 RepID=A0A367KXN5_RHIST|nr:hypothetical protein CU098_010908 [Rhizopus stolonifer]
MSILSYWFGLGDDSKSNDSNRLQSNNLGRQEETQPSLGLFNIPPSYIKYPEGMFDRRSFMQGVKLIEVAMDEFDSGNDANGLDIYLTGLDKILAALPAWRLNEKKPEDAWEQANVDPSTIANQAVPQPMSDAIPNSMLSAFNNMFDRGPNVGIDVITKHGFVLTNKVRVEHPIILLNGSPFLWKAPPRAEGYMPMKDWNLEAFKIFEIVSPRPELIMFGTGREFAPVPEHIRNFFFKLGIQVDQMGTKNAAATYNVLAEEGRRIAAVLLPLDEQK